MSKVSKTTAPKSPAKPPTKSKKSPAKPPTKSKKSPAKLPTKSKKSSPKISIIVPIYNAEKYLKTCLNSISSQTYENLEVLLIDDGSTDSSAKICKNYPSFHYHYQSNSGVSSARNLGIKLATGDYIAFLDADDWLEPTFCSTLLNNAESHSADYVACGYNRITGKKLEQINSDHSTQTLSPSDFTKYIYNVQLSYGFCHMKLIKTSALKSVRFNESLIAAEDALFNLELMNNLNSVLLINQPLYNYRFNPSSVVKKYDPNYIQKYQSAMELISDKFPSSVDLQNFIMYHFLLILVNYCAHPKNPHKLTSLKSAAKIPIFARAIKLSNYQNLSLTRKIPLFFLKHHLYLPTLLVGRIRQYNNQKELK